MNPVTTTPQDVVNPLAHLLSQGAMIPTPAPGYSLTLTHKRLRFGDDEESEVHLRMEDNVDEGNVSDGAAMNRMSKRQVGRFTFHNPVALVVD
ncbi:hypothetical protein BCR39DRAFT_53868 [Naematelia encephala]|uniref:Uncharacterized protein n=1 Tax=Naematelia encephala TaxID=71784 RepID=A0A1Y2AGB3_9TREE|nr:hypothetical protein BCR39DRAFT_53868 [Naematelia encephala]